jgi:peroxiredoxin Q/BCP
MSLKNPEQLKAGDPAPDFTATAVGGKYRGGEVVSLKDFRGSPVVLYFYPKDDTPGCTAQACGLRDEWSNFQGRAEIFGVSIDPVESHEKFIAKYSLPFPLLSDPEKKKMPTKGL